MSKRQFWIKMASLAVLAGLGHRVVEVAKTSSTVNNYNTTVEKTVTPEATPVSDIS